MKVTFSERATADLESIAEYIAEDDPVAAVAWVDRLVASAYRIGDSPMAGRALPELKNPKIREVMLRRYRIVYRVERDHIIILTVFEGSRLLRL